MARRRARRAATHDGARVLRPRPGRGGRCGEYLRHYYAWLGPYADAIAASAATDASTVRQYVDAFADAGCDELVLFPSDADPEQVDLLADAVGR
jgi:hypothetical protein